MSTETMTSLGPVTILHGDVLDVLPTLPERSVQCCVTSPPYWSLRDYNLPPSVWPDGSECCLGLEPTPDAFVAHLVHVFGLVRRVLRDDGVLWCNMGDSYAGGGGYCPDAPSNQAGSKSSGGAGKGGAKTKSATKRLPGLKPKDLIGVPWRVAFALQADGWYLRSAIVWAKGLSFCPTYAGSVMPESCLDRPTSAYEMVFLLTKRPRYYYDAGAVREDSFAKNSHDATGCGYLASGQTRQSGNRDRKLGDEFDRPDGHRGASTPWTGATRNLRNVWAVPEPLYRLRHDLTDEQRSDAVAMLIQRGATV